MIICLLPPLLQAVVAYSNEADIAGIALELLMSKAWDS